MKSREKGKGGEVRDKIMVKAISSKILKDPHKNIEIDSNSNWIPNSLRQEKAWLIKHFRVIRQKSGPLTVPKKISVG